MNKKNAIGVQVIKDVVPTLPDTPGVYRMIGAKGEVLYVGKAGVLKKRVHSYTQTARLSERIRMMVNLTHSMECVVTQTEAEALLLEANLIKKLKPRFNILLRDDKSFPFIHLTSGHDFPMVRKHRGARKDKGDYFGPFASATEVNHTLTVLQRVFLLRNCSNNVFAARRRPCLQYHIKRCTAPCVGLVSQKDYALQVQQARDFLCGKSRALQDQFALQMKQASQAMEYETAALYRDRIKALNSIQARQDIQFDNMQDADVMVIVQKNGQSCVQMFFFRKGGNFGNCSYFPAHAPEDRPEQILSAVMGQFYQNREPPREIIVNIRLALAEKQLLEQALAPARIVAPVRGKRMRMLAFAKNNAIQALERYQAQKKSDAALLEGVRDLFKLEDIPARIEVYDNSHTAGQNMVGAMIVAGAEGFEKKSYRKFNIKTASAADDYAMMAEILRRRFKAILQEEKDHQALWPDLVLIDGGKGQLSAAQAVCEDLGIENFVTLVAIAKGKDRNAGREKFFVPGQKPFQLPVQDPVLHYLQRLRDEAHRFAIGAHKKKRKKQALASTLDDLPGVGPARKRALLHHFGSARAVADAKPEDIAKVPGFSKAAAQRIYDYFH